MATKMALRIGSRSVPLIAAHEKINLQHVTDFKPLQDWANALAKEEEAQAQAHEKESSISGAAAGAGGGPTVKVKEVVVRNVEYFGSTRVGFANLAVDAELTETGQKTPGFIFMRGGAVAVLVILRSTDPSSGQTSEHVILTNQARLAIPSFNFPEIPAGMLDGSGDFAGKCAEELKEECGLTLDHDSLIDMTKLAYGDTWKGMYPSVGGCDEFLRLFVCFKDMPWNEVQALEGRLGGIREHGENISLSLVELKHAYKAAPDAKLLSALALLHALKADGKL
ncbi:hypothetical protein BG004_000564 [Podila humilis]|nr:hypothetical protein BG004_000564 [Podila humilis]